MKTKLGAAAFVALLSVTAVGMPALAHPGHPHEAPQSAEGDGVVKAIDAKAGTITLQHGPIAALGWPAMTMSFKVASPALLSGVSVGKKVHFVLKNQGGKPVVSEIHVM